MNAFVSLYLWKKIHLFFSQACFKMWVTLIEATWRVVTQDEEIHRQSKEKQIASEKNLHWTVQFQFNGGLDTHMLIQYRYRHYRHVGTASNQVAVASEDGLDDGKFAAILADVFNVRDVPGMGEGRLGLGRYRGKETKSWRWTRFFVEKMWKGQPFLRRFNTDEYWMQTIGFINKTPKWK